MKEYLELKEEVQTALAEKKPVVALESTIIAHGMPYPQNVEAAMAMEHRIRDLGGIPATVALLNGKLKAGLTQEELEYLGHKGNKAGKVSRRDIPFLLSSRQPGATTVSASLVIAGMAGIRVFATGGIGGVHRGAAESMDISADLPEIARTNIAVVCAGAKSILDIGSTLEYLETQGIPVIGYCTEQFPAFYTRKSGYPVDYRINSVDEIARILKIKWELGLTGGVIVANPIPEKEESEYSLIRNAIEQALSEAGANEVRGKHITPFLLERIRELTEGQSLKSNMALALHNAGLAAEIAVALYRSENGM